MPTTTLIAAAAGANAGSSPPSPSFGNYPNDMRGTVSFGTGSGPSAGAQITLTFGGGFSGYLATVPVLISPRNSATAAIGPWYASLDTTGRILTIGCTGTPTASQGASVYSVAYAVVL